jgi:hypothetical protein
MICPGQTFTACISSIDRSTVLLLPEECVADSGTGLSRGLGEVAIHAPETEEGEEEGQSVSAASPGPSSPLGVGSTSTPPPVGRGEERDRDGNASPSGDASPSTVLSLSRGLFGGSRQGKFLLGTMGRASPSAYMEFDAEVTVLHHPNGIWVNYEPVVHIGVVRQTARLVAIM